MNGSLYPLDCGHYGDELDNDEHLGGCLDDPEAAQRLERVEGFWDSQGMSGYEL